MITSYFSLIYVISFLANPQVPPNSDHLTVRCDTIDSAYWILIYWVSRSSFSAVNYDSCCNSCSENSDRQSALIKKQEISRFQSSIDSYLWNFLYIFKCIDFYTNQPEGLLHHEVCNILHIENGLMTQIMEKIAQIYSSSIKNDSNCCCRQQLH